MREVASPCASAHQDNSRSRTPTGSSAHHPARHGPPGPDKSPLATPASAPGITPSARLSLRLPATGPVTLAAMRLSHVSICQHGGDTISLSPVRHQAGGGQGQGLGGQAMDLDLGQNQKPAIVDHQRQVPGPRPRGLANELIADLLVPAGGMKGQSDQMRESCLWTGSIEVLPRALHRTLDLGNRFVGDVLTRGIRYLFPGGWQGHI